MAGAVGPACLRRGHVLGKAGALIIEGTHGMFEHRFIHIVPDADIGRADTILLINHRITTGCRYTTEVKPPDFIPGYLCLGAIIPGYRRSAVHGSTRVEVDQLVKGTGRETFCRIKTH